MALGDAKVGTGREFQSAAQSMSVEHGDDRLSEARERVERRMTVAHPMASEGLRAFARPRGDVAARAERLPCARKDHDPRVRAFDLPTPPR